MRLIKRGDIEMIEKLINDSQFVEYKMKLMDDTIVKERIINVILRRDKELCDIILEFFGFVDNLPLYDDTSDIKYDIENNCLINKKTDINYIFNGNNFEEIYGSTEILYSICENDKIFNEFRKNLEVNLKRECSEREIEFMLEKSRIYKEYINSEFTEIINDIKANDSCIDSKGECHELLYEYIRRKPSNWEVDLLWNNIMDI
jgi:hypothetical protein